MTGSLLRLSNGLKFIVLKQIIYNEDHYFFVKRVTDDEEGLIEQYDILSEVIKDGKSLLQTVKDHELRHKLAKIFKKEIDKELDKIDEEK